MPTYQVTINGRPKVLPPKSKPSYNEELNATTIMVEAVNRNEARRIGAKFGDVVGVSTSK